MKVMNPKITALDWLEALKGLGKDDTVFLDPPYLDGNVRAYRADDVDHEKLVRMPLKAKFRWVLSAYAHPVYAGLGKPCHREDVQLRTTDCDRVREKRQECLWKNF
jgi:site-specific DNA-adenine methylase